MFLLMQLSGTDAGAMLSYSSGDERAGKAAIWWLANSWNRPVNYACLSLEERKERETLEGDNLFTSETSSAAFSFFSLRDLNWAVAGLSRGRRESPNLQRSQWNHSENSHAEFINVSGGLEVILGSRFALGGSVNTIKWSFRVLASRSRPFYFSGYSEHMFEKKDVHWHFLHTFWEGICVEKMVSKNNFSQVKRRFKGCKMITATGNRMPLLQAASHDAACESAASLTFSPPPAHSHGINFTALSGLKSSSFHAMTCFVCVFVFCFFLSLHVESPPERSDSSLNTQLKPQFNLCHAGIFRKSISLNSSSDHSSCHL